ncbi:MAG TPA: hypothetical protein VFB62_23230 [Polyangiaceae bacterium]|nr:hypothetical protein [Polyangiaceae bacterium]
MGELFACPFCRQLYEKGEVEICPECDVHVKPLAELPPSHDAQLLDEPEHEVPPEDQLLPWTYVGRGRGALAVLALAGLAAFFMPWVHEFSPEIRTLSGFEFARHLPWIWAGGVAWFILLPLALSRRTIRQMRGARVAAGFLAGMVLTTVAARLSIVVRPPHPLVPVRYSWGSGLYTAGALALIALFFAVRFGGSLEDMPSRQARRGNETLH